MRFSVLARFPATPHNTELAERFEKARITKRWMRDAESGMSYEAEAVIVPTYKLLDTGRLIPMIDGLEGDPYFEIHLVEDDPKTTIAAYRETEKELMPLEVRQDRKGRRTRMLPSHTVVLSARKGDTPKIARPMIVPDKTTRALYFRARVWNAAGSSLSNASRDRAELRRLLKSKKLEPYTEKLFEVLRTSADDAQVTR